jgi:hypothetical protein
MIDGRDNGTYFIPVKRDSVRQRVQHQRRRRLLQLCRWLAGRHRAKQRWHQRRTERRAGRLILDWSGHALHRSGRRPIDGRSDFAGDSFATGRRAAGQRGQERGQLRLVARRTPTAPGRSSSTINNVNGTSYEQDPSCLRLRAQRNSARLITRRMCRDALPATPWRKLPTDRSRCASTSGGLAAGQYYLEIDGYVPSDGVLIVSPEGGVSNNADNIVTYQAAGNGWIIESRDLPQNPPTLQDNGAEPTFSFVFIPFAPKPVGPQGTLAAALVGRRAAQRETTIKRP